MDKKGEWRNEIAVVISDIDGKSDIWIEENYSINLGNHLYEPFKRYFMGQIERNLFHG